jgi:hypothetical protein
MKIAKNSRLLTTLVLAAALSMVQVSVLRAGDPEVPITNTPAVKKTLSSSDFAPPSRRGLVHRTQSSASVWVARIEWSARVLLVQLLKR